MPHKEHHKLHRAGWLRAGVLGANDGIVSTSSLILGFVSSGADHHNAVLAGVAGLIAGAVSMAAGEYVSVSSQTDIEKADLAIEKAALEDDYEAEKEELARIYQGRGLEIDLARTVAAKLMEHDALASHARDEIGITESGRAKPLTAAGSSFLSFALGAACPLIALLLLSQQAAFVGVASVSVCALAILGAVSAFAGGANITRSVLRVTCWGLLAMAVTSMVGTLFNV